MENTDVPVYRLELAEEHTRDLEAEEPDTLSARAAWDWLQEGMTGVAYRQEMRTSTNAPTEGVMIPLKAEKIFVAQEDAKQWSLRVQVADHAELWVELVEEQVVALRADIRQEFQGMVERMDRMYADFARDKELARHTHLTRWNELGEREAAYIKREAALRQMELNLEQSLARCLNEHHRLLEERPLETRSITVKPDDGPTVVYEF